MLNLYWIFASLFAGFLTFLSPCVLPVLPLIFSTSLGKSKWRPLYIVSGLVFGFTLLGILFNFLGSFFGISPQTIRWISIILLFLAGIFFIFPSLSAKVFSPISRKLGNVEVSEENFWGAFLIGISLGALWSPCAGPIFAIVLSGAIVQKKFLDSFFLLFAYAIGAGIPMLMVAYLGNRLVQKIKTFARYENKIRRLTGVLLILAAGIFVLELDARLIASIPISLFNSNKLEDQIVNKIQNNRSDLMARHSPNEISSKLPVLGLLPPLSGGIDWINSKPLTKEELRGKVVLIDFWTYSCVNCLRTLPYVKNWYKKYHDQGFVIIGVHTPEFAFEKEKENVAKAVKDLGIFYPVVLDNDYAIWKNFDNHYWPAHYLVDAEGRIREIHHGEGEYAETETAIQVLLKEKGVLIQKNASEKVEEEVDFSRIRSPETYLGYERASNFKSSQEVVPDQFSSYTFPSELSLNQWGLSGSWKIEKEKITNQNSHAKIRFQFEARKLNLVMGAAEKNPIEATIKIDGKVIETNLSGKDVKNGKVLIQDSRLYELIDLKEVRGVHLFEIEFLNSNIFAFAFTFG